MLDVRITAVRKANYPDLSAEYENPLDSPCDIEEGMTFVSVNAERPRGLCVSAWETMLPFVSSLARGEGDFFGGWMKNRYSAMISCNDGFRPVSFLLEAVRDTEN